MRRFSGLLVVIMWMSLFIAIPAAQAAPFVDGIIFRDFNYNGVQDVPTDEPGVAGINVFVYLSDGITPIATAVSGADGSYVVDLAGVAAAGDPLRVEFEIPAPQNEYLIPGRRDPAGTNGDATTVRFVDAYADATFQDINLALVNPADYCDDTPYIITSCYVFGVQNRGLPVLVGFPYESGTTDLAGDSAAAQAVYDVLAEDNDIGAVWGTAHRKRSDDVFIAAFARQHVGYNNNLPADQRPDTIYRLNVPSGNISIFAQIEAGTDNHNQANFEADAGFFNDVGNVGFGDIDISDDEQRLYITNMFDRTIYVLDAVTGDILDTIATPIPPDCANDWVRPGALKYKDGVLYIGVTCTGPQQANLRAYVYRNGNQIINIPLDYPRGQTSQIAPGGAPGSNLANWRPWIADDTSIIELDFGGFHYPQPWLLDLEFDENKFLIMNLADRFGFQAGDDNSGTGTFEGVSAGDILRFSPNNTTFPDGRTGWDLENNGSDGVNTTIGAGNGDGPGGGEFYFHERYEMNNPNLGTAGSIHQETSLAGVAQVLGRREVINAAFDPAPEGDFRTGGLIFHSHETGQRTRSIQVYEEINLVTVGKAAGVGDVEVLCRPAPLEIGNYVWFDEDRDGVQDPEDPIGGVVVTLYIDHDNDETTPVRLLATTITDASGHYYFNESNIPDAVDFDGSGVAGDVVNERMYIDIDNFGTLDLGEPAGILPFKTYEVRIDDPSNFAAAGPLFEFYSTAVLAGANNEIIPDVDGNYRRDSNGVNDGASANETEFVAADNYVTTGEFVTGDLGANDHTFDFGFAQEQPPVTATPTATSTATATPTGTLPATATPTNTGTPGPSPTPTNTGTPGPSPTPTPFGTPPDVTDQPPGDTPPDDVPPGEQADAPGVPPVEELPATGETGRNATTLALLLGLLTLLALPAVWFARRDH